ncbi:MAG: BCD family MFS transporter [Kiloniellales bacterium]|nr:BCD family MFS transporter [Kiloniellales bacterium]
MTVKAPRVSLSWLQIVRLGLAQSALGAIVVLTTSTMNRVMVVELALPAMLPGALVAFHYAIQVLRPRWGYGSDIGGRRTPWIVGGMAVLALGGVLAAAATAAMSVSLALGVVLATVAFALIGGGVGASGTSLLVLLAKLVDPERRAPAATIVWLMMISGMIVTAGVAGHFLDPFSLSRLILVAAVVAGSAFALTVAAVWGIEACAGAAPRPAEPVAAEPQPSFREALAQVWAEPTARRFSVFIFVSMLAYSAQDLILEPFAGAVFGKTPGESTQLAGVQHGGVLLGMILIAVLGRACRGRRFGSLRAWAMAGCVLSAAALFTLASGGFVGIGFPLEAAVFALGVANGAFAVAAIGSMMGLVSEGRRSREGTRMGLWGAAQAIAFGLGGFAGTVAIDVTRALFDQPALAYGVVFMAEGLLFLLAAYLATQVTQPAGEPAARPAPVPEPGLAEIGGR